MKRLAVILLVVLMSVVLLAGCGSSIVGKYKEVGGNTTLELRANKSFTWDYSRGGLNKYDGDYRVEDGYVILDPSDSGLDLPFGAELKILENERLLLEPENYPPPSTYVKVN